MKTEPMKNRMRSKLLFGSMLVGVASVSVTQETPESKDQKSKPEATSQVPDSASIPEAPATVNVSEVVFDDKIEERLRSILTSKEWFRNEEVHVESGVVFLTGETSLEKYRTWASELAGKTEDVVAVVNRITVSNLPWFDATPALQTIRGLIQGAVRGMPLTAISLVLLVLTWIVARLGQHAADATNLRRVQTPLLREVAR